MAPAPRLTRTQRRAQIREELIAAAAQVFAKKGYQAATVGEIAAEAGYTIGALYSNFSGKRALFEAVFSQQADEQFSLARSFGQSGVDLPALAQRLLDQDPNERRFWLLWCEAIVETLRDPAKEFPLRQVEAHSRSSIAKILSAQLPDLEDADCLASALQALWRGWLLGTAAEPPGDPASFARAIGWLIAGATSDIRPSRKSKSRTPAPGQ